MKVKRVKHEVIFDELNSLNSLEEYYRPMQLDIGSKERRMELAALLTDAFLFFFSTFEVHKAYNNVIERQLYQRLLADKVSEAVTKVTGIDSYMSNHITEMSREVVNTTFKNTEKAKKAEKVEKVKSGNSPTSVKTSASNDISTPTSLIYNPHDGASESPYTNQQSDAPTHLEDNYGYWLSYERAEDIAKSEANTFLNYTDYADAKDRGYTKKRWLTMLDDKVRQTHSEVEGDTIGIDEVFQVGNSQMRFPHDLASSPDPKEVIGCRCAVEYLK